MQEFSWDSHRLMSGEHFHIALQKDEYVRSFSTHGHKDMYEWVVVLAGNMSHELNGRVFADKRGSITLIRPGDSHKMSGMSFTIINLAFPRLYFDFFASLWEMPELVSSFDSSREVPRKSVDESDFLRLEELLKKIISFGRGGKARQHVTLFFTELLSGEFSSFIESGEAGHDKFPDWLREALEWVSRNSDRDISLAELRVKTARCPEHLSRAFSRYLGMSPSSYLLARRLERAASLLDKSNYSISEIAFESGFQNISHFCRKFKLRYKISPREYRESKHSAI